MIKPPVLLGPRIKMLQKLFGLSVMTMIIDGVDAAPVGWGIT
jgi:hypothetical protein